MVEWSVHFKQHTLAAFLEYSKPFGQKPTRKLRCKSSIRCSVDSDGWNFTDIGQVLGESDGICQQLSDMVVRNVSVPYK